MYNIMEHPFLDNPKVFEITKGIKMPLTSYLGARKAADFLGNEMLWNNEFYWNPVVFPIQSNLNCPRSTFITVALEFSEPNAWQVVLQKSKSLVQRSTFFENMRLCKFRKLSQGENPSWQIAPSMISCLELQLSEQSWEVQALKFKSFNRCPWFWKECSKNLLSSP